MRCFYGSPMLDLSTSTISETNIDNVGNQLNSSGARTFAAKKFPVQRKIIKRADNKSYEWPAESFLRSNNFHVSSVTMPVARSKSILERSESAQKHQGMMYSLWQSKQDRRKTFLFIDLAPPDDAGGKIEEKGLRASRFRFDLRQRGSYLFPVCSINLRQNIEWTNRWDKSQTIVSLDSEGSLYSECPVTLTKSK